MSRVVINSRAFIRASLFVTTGVLAAAGFGPSLHAQYQAPELPQLTRPLQGFTEQGLEALPVRSNVWAIFGAGGNITVSVGTDGIAMVDTGRADMSDKVLAVIKRLGTGVDPTPDSPPVPIRFIVNTHVHDENSGGNEKIQAAAEFVRGGEHIMAHENVLARMSAPLPGQKTSPRPSEAWPTDTFRGEQTKFGRFFNGEGVQLIHVPSAHTDGDVIVWFRYSDVMAVGDLFSTTGWPVIDLERGGSFQGVVNGLNLILKTGLSGFRGEGGTMVIPGHGRICNLSDVAFYRDMVTIIRDRILDGVKRGMTLEQVKAAKPTQGWDNQYGSKAGPWTTDMFIEAAYRSLTKSKAKS